MMVTNNTRGGSFELSRVCTVKAASITLPSEPENRHDNKGRVGDYAPKQAETGVISIIRIAVLLVAMKGHEWDPRTV